MSLTVSIGSQAYTARAEVARWSSVIRGTTLLLVALVLQVALTHELVKSICGIRITLQIIMILLQYGLNIMFRKGIGYII